MWTDLIYHRERKIIHRYVQADGLPTRASRSLIVLFLYTLLDQIRLSSVH